MNALPVKNPTPQEIIDDLIADIGIFKVALVTVARVFKRTRPPDIKTVRGLGQNPSVDQLSNHLRADMGLPPKHDHQIKIDMISLTSPKF